MNSTKKKPQPADNRQYKLFENYPSSPLFIRKSVSFFLLAHGLDRVVSCPVKPLKYFPGVLTSGGKSIILF